MNYQEEQQNELQALQEIYYNEIEVISDTDPISFVIAMKSQGSEDETIEDASDSGSDGEQGDDDDNDDDVDHKVPSELRPPPLSVSLKFVLPSKYPEEKPSVEVIDQTNLDEYDIQELLVNLDDKAEESLGTVMIFTLVSDVIEWLFTKTERVAEQINEVREQKVREQEIQDKKRFEGTPVNVESFLAWKAKFDAEMLKAKLEKNKLQGIDESQPTGQRRGMTGREMFETDKSLIESDLNFEELDQGQIESLLQNIDDLELADDDDYQPDDSDSEDDSD